VENYIVKTFNVKYGVIVDIFNGYIPIESLTYDMLYKVMTAIKNGCSDRWLQIDLSEMDEKKYFVDSEVEKFKRPIVEKEMYEDIVFDNFVQINSNKFSVKLTATELVKWRNIGKARYNPETQRDLIEHEDSDGNSYYKIDINKKSINNMYDLLLKNDFECDDLTFNANTDINTTDDSLPKIVNGKLIIPVGCKLDLIDGWHRSQSICLVKDLNPDFEFTFGIKIVTWSTEKANQFILLQDIKNHLSAKQTTRIDKNNQANYIIDELKLYSKFHLRGTIDNETAYNLNIIINSVFNNPQKREEAVDIKFLIIDNINELVERNKLYDKKLSKEEWFIYLYSIKYTKSNNLNFIKIASSFNINELIDEVSYKNTPLKKSYTVIENAIKEVETIGN
jgi:hypothetical protein